MDITVVEIQPTGEFGGHIFEYQPSDDLFKCVNDGCGIYEVVARATAREQGIGEITPCPGAQPATAKTAAAEPAGNGCPRGCQDPSGEDCKASLISPCPQGRYQEDASGQFNHACGHLRSSTCPGCGVCKACDACYCGEE